MVAAKPTTLSDLRRVRTHQWDGETCRLCWIRVDAVWLTDMPSCPGSMYRYVGALEKALLGKCESKHCKEHTDISS